MMPGAQSKSAASSRGNSWKGNASLDFAGVLIALTGLLRSICVSLVRSRCLLQAVTHNSRERESVRDTNVAGLWLTQLLESREALEWRCNSDSSSAYVMEHRNVCCTTTEKRSDAVPAEAFALLFG